MNRQEYIGLIEKLQEELSKAGIAQLNDPTLYLERNTKSGELQSRLPRDQLVEMLCALELYLSIADQETYDQALATINRSSDGPIISRVRVNLADGSESIRLDALDSLGGVRRRLSTFIERLRRDPEPTQEQTAAQRKGPTPEPGMDP